ncbi:VOC family protein [Nocardia camponoti]|uniref:Glyoxalase n=1 Tax=Nocardia camponoti TaxID=1616106 RepID=A0A917VAY1_9NOCA|nr:glyoxalase [Nocardia camponoti]GGK57781.1 glyoxalase [Nocardia camponoti]
MSVKLGSIVIPVSDLDAAKHIYSALFGEPHTDTAYYVGYSVDGLEVGLNPNGDVAQGPVAYTAVPDVDAAKKAVIDAGASEIAPPREVSPGVRVCVLEDTDANPFGLIGK